jgi:hypothetical protein
MRKKTGQVSILIRRRLVMKVTLYWDQRPREFDLDRLEVAWLVYEEERSKLNPPVANSLSTAISARRRLVNEFKWTESDATVYCVAIKNELWSPE